MIPALQKTQEQAPNLVVELARVKNLGHPKSNFLPDHIWSEKFCMERSGLARVQSLWARSHLAPDEDCGGLIQADLPSQYVWLS